MKISKIASVVVLGAGIFIGCGGGGSSSSSTSTTYTTGKVVDGYLYNVKVCYKGTNICATTDVNGKFTLEKQDSPFIVYSNKDSINVQTTTNYSSILSAPKGFNIVTPLTTALVAVNNNLYTLSSVLGIDLNELSSVIKSDPVNLIKIEKENNLYNKYYAINVLLEKITDTLMLDSHKSDYNKKILALKALFKYAENNNKTIANLTSNDFKKIYYGYKNLANERISDVNSTKIGIIASNLANTLDYNFSKANVFDLEKEVSKEDLKSLITLDETNLTQNVAGLKSRLVSDILNDLNSSLIKVSVNKNLDKNTSINLSIKPYFLIEEGNFIIQKGSDFNISSNDEVVYSVKLENNDIVKLNNNSLEAFNQTGNVNLLINQANIQNPIESVKLYITPKDIKTNVVGDTKVVTLLIKQPINSKILTSVTNTTSSTDTVIEKKLGTFELNATNGVLQGDNQFVDFKNTNGEVINAISNNPEVASVEYNSTDVKAYGVYNGSATITYIVLDKANWKVYVNEANISVNGVDLPPVLDVEKNYYEIVSNDGNSVDINISTIIKDPDNSIDDITVSDENNKCSYNNNVVTCPVDLGMNTITLKAYDGVRYSNPVNVTVNVKNGNVAPTLTLFTPEVDDIDTMSTKEYSFVANDLNGKDTFKVNATSNDESIAKVKVDMNNSKIIVLTQPKVGSATISVWAEDNEGAKSKVATFVVRTHNKLAELLPTLYAVPPVDKNGTLLDNRYMLTNFDMGYDIEANEVLVSGDINISSDDNLTLNQFVLEAYPDNGLFGGKDSYDGITYGFAFANSFSYNGEFIDGRVLAFDVNESTPYYWALATKDEICNAFKDNNKTLELINRVNKKTITCE